MSNRAEFGPQRERERGFSEYRLLQDKAGPYAAEVVQDLAQSRPELLDLFRSLERLRAGRGLCAVTATSAAINVVLRRRLIADSDTASPLRVGDFYRFLLPHHHEFLENPQSGKQQPWWVINPESRNTYHHALVAFARACGVFAEGVHSFEDVRAFANLVSGGGAAVVSLRNTFVRDVTTGNDPECFFEQDGAVYVRTPDENGQLVATEFLPGTHAITLVDFDHVNGFTYLDSYALPQQQIHDPVRTIEPERLADYLPADVAARKAILFHSEPIPPSQQWNVRADYIPAQVQEEITLAVNEKMQVQRPVGYFWGRG